ncbi:MAG TPA: SulP family inorganic anion transporter [Chloroflexota bacterium]|nr:SulP family inorganic anion transporter [Chloroflexota bacterium]
MSAASAAPAAPATGRRVQLFRGLRGVPRSGLLPEIVAGVTLAALMIPLNIGYADVAGLPPIVGLYAAILPMIAFACLSSSRHLVAGPDAPIAALIGALLGSMAVRDDPLYVQLAYAQALVCALVFFAFWWFRLGFLANFLSKAVMVGFITGLGIEVFVSQLKKIMGVEIEAEGFFRELLALVAAIPRASLWSLAIGLGTVAVIRLLKRFAPRLPGALIALLGATAVVALLGLDQQGVSVLGQVPSGLPTPTFPQVSLGQWLALFPGALAICGVTLADGLLVGRRYAQKYGDGIDADQELLAFGAANAATGLSGGFAVGSSASRTAALDGVGAKSQIPSLVGAGVVALVLLFFSDLLALLPNAALGGIVANAVLSLIEVDELRTLARVRRDEFWIAAVCALCVLVFGSLQAVVIAFLLSAIDLVRRVASPQTGVLAPLPGGRGYAVSAGPHQAFTEPGLVIYRFGGPLFFGNATVFQDQVQRLVAEAPAGHEGTAVRWVVLDAAAVSDVDSTGADALENTIDTLQEHGIVFAVARAEPPLPDLLRKYGLLERIGPGRLYPTDRDAVAAFRQETGAPAGAPPEVPGGQAADSPLEALD